MSKRKPDHTHFLNVDLDIRAKSGLRTLLTAFEPSVVVLSYEPRRFLSVEMNAQPRDINEAIRLFCDLVNNLEPSVRTIWDRCASRCMNIGIQAAATPHQVQFEVSQEAIVMLRRLGAEIAITVYGASGQQTRAPASPLKQTP